MAAARGRILTLFTKYFNSQGQYYVTVAANRTHQRSKNVLWGSLMQIYFILRFKFHGLSHRPQLSVDLLNSVRAPANSPARTLKQHCWNCDLEIDSVKEQYFCDCGVIQPPIEGRTLFEVMGLKVSYDVDTADLTRRFRHLQSLLHPDKFTQKCDVERSYSDLQSMMVNKAYRTLNKPISRGQYLLKLHGQRVEEAEKELDADFLMEIMEVNEEIGEASSRELLSDLAVRNRGTMDTLLHNLSTAFRENQIVTAKSILTRLKYYENIEEKLKEAEAQFSDKQ